MGYSGGVSYKIDCLSPSDPTPNYGRVVPQLLSFRGRPQNSSSIADASQNMNPPFPFQLADRLYLIRVYLYTYLIKRVFPNLVSSRCIAASPASLGTSQ